MSAARGGARVRRYPSGFGLKIRVIWTLIQRDIILSFRQSRAGYLQVLLEPVTQFAVMYLIFTFAGRNAGYGTDLGIFLATGIVPFFMFIHMSSRVMLAVRGSRAFSRIPTVGVMDVAIAKGILEFLTLLIFGAAVFLLLAYMGHPALLHDPTTMMKAVTVLGLTGLGVGMVNGVLSTMFKFYALAYSLVARGLLFFSGVFFVPSILPEEARKYLYFNPVLHGIEWFRTGIFPSYPAFDLSQRYLAGWALGSLTLGVVLFKVTRGKLAQ